MKSHRKKKEEGFAMAVEHSEAKFGEAAAIVILTIFSSPRLVQMPVLFRGFPAHDASRSFPPPFFFISNARSAARLEILQNKQKDGFKTTTTTK